MSPAKDAPQWYGQTFKDGIIPYFAQDVSFTPDQLAALNMRDPQGLLTGKLDLGHDGIFGISSGGMVASQAYEADSRLAACLMMDVAMPVNVVKNGSSELYKLLNGARSLLLRTDSAPVWCNGLPEPSVPHAPRAQR